MPFEQLLMTRSDPSQRRSGKCPVMTIDSVSVPYDHPVLWSLRRKRVEERKVAAENLRLQQQLSERLRSRQLQEDYEFRDMLRHNPWGKPGGGAPNKSIRLRNITLDGLHPEQKLKPRIPIPNFTMKTPKNAGGGGAPIRSASGRLLTYLREDPIISFNSSNKRHVDNLLRYKTSLDAQRNYKQQLDRIVAERAKLERIREMPNEEFDDKNFCDAFGKRGPGGLPWRYPGDIGHNFMNSMGWTTQENLQKIDGGKSPPSRVVAQVSPKTRKVGNLASPPTKTSNKCCTNCACQCNKPKKPGPLIVDEQTQTSPPHQPPYQGQRKKKNPPNVNFDNGCGVELVPLLARRRAQQRPISLSTTDVTKFKSYNPNVDNPGWHEQRVELLDELSRQVKHKHLRTEKTRQSEIDHSQRHFDTWDSFWGRPGHGAPVNIDKIKRQNLNDILYTPHEL